MLREWFTTAYAMLHLCTCQWSDSEKFYCPVVVGSAVIDLSVGVRMFTPPLHITQLCLAEESCTPHHGILCYNRKNPRCLLHAIFKLDIVWYHHVFKLRLVRLVHSTSGFRNALPNKAEASTTGKKKNYNYWNGAIHVSNISYENFRGIRQWLYCANTWKWSIVCQY